MVKLYVFICSLINYALEIVILNGSIAKVHFYFHFQADMRTVRRSTTERKSMSTKTTIKRIALVAVAALGFGMLSSVPSQAYTSGYSLTVDANDTVSVGDTATATIT